ncbi:hypothetical protein IG631_00739 [Alternaria alternata]|nr:hypothetical protein IG631_00739 [Alternaria alternata]
MLSQHCAHVLAPATDEADSPAQASSFTHCSLPIVDGPIVATSPPSRPSPADHAEGTSLHPAALLRI